MTKKELIEQYAHNFRKLELSEEYLKKVLKNFTEDLEECIFEECEEKE